MDIAIQNLHALAANSSIKLAELAVERDVRLRAVAEVEASADFAQRSYDSAIDALASLGFPYMESAGTRSQISALQRFRTSSGKVFDGVTISQVPPDQREAVVTKAASRVKSSARVFDN